jgi:8-oxo-dGTP pyrophosphatase MutT (NUDIX family)
MIPAPVTPSLAATTILVRARGSQPEMLLLKRGEHARFMPNAFVFAGGALDASDEEPEIYALCADMDDRRASDALRVPSNGLRFFVAAIREAFEESGLLLAYDAAGKMVNLASWDESQLREIRLQVSSGQTTLAALCKLHGWRLAVEQLIFYSHWITPPGRVRFDTRFFLASAPPEQQASLAGNEMSELVWRTAAEALAEHDAKQLLLMFPTRTLLKQIAKFRDLDALFDYAATPRSIEPFTPSMPPNP